jgi:hypothetical protein
VDPKRILLVRFLFLVALRLQLAGMPPCLVARHLVLVRLAVHCLRMQARVSLEAPRGSLVVPLGCKAVVLYGCARRFLRKVAQLQFVVAMHLRRLAS